MTNAFIFNTKSCVNIMCVEDWWWYIPATLLDNIKLMFINLVCQMIKIG